MGLVESNESTMIAHVYATKVHDRMPTFVVFSVGSFTHSVDFYVDFFTNFVDFVYKLL